MKTYSSVYTLSELLRRLDEGCNFGYLYFWGHQVEPDGKISASCCSQWYPAGFEADGCHYTTAEHYMMARKARLFNDSAALKAILSSTEPSEAKALGRKVSGFNSEIWDRHCIEIVVKGNFYKFSQNAELGAWLLGTAPQILVEASPVDRIWGIGLKKSDARARDPRQWQGQNLLGFALVQVRDMLTGETAAPTRQ